MKAYVCQTITSKSLDAGSSLAHRVHLQRIQVKFVYEGHRVKVIGSRSRSQEQRKAENARSRNVKLRSAITPILLNI